MKVFAIVAVGLMLAAPLAGCTMSQEIKHQCQAMGFEPGSDKMTDCQMRLTEAAMSAPQGGAPLIMPPPVNFQPLTVHQPMRLPQPTRIQANCTSYQMGIYTNMNCH